MQHSVCVIISIINISSPFYRLGIKRNINFTTDLVCAFDVFVRFLSHHSTIRAHKEKRRH